MRSAERAFPAISGLYRAAPLLLTVLLAACAGVRGGSEGAAADTAKAGKSTPADAPQKPPLIPDLDNAVIDAFESGLKALHEGRLPEAEQTFLALTKAHPDLGGPHANLGIVYRQSCLLYTSPSPRDGLLSRMPSSA